MENQEFLKLDTQNKIEHILSLEDYKKQQELLDFLKVKNKFEHIKVSAKVKTIKSNPKSVNNINSKENVENELYIDLDLIEDNPFQPRLDISEQKIEELATSIKEKGLLQPILLNKFDEDKYEIIAGHTRKEAVKFNGETKIKAIIFSSYSKDDENYKTAMLSNAIVENIHRNDLDAIETAISFSNALNEGIYKNQAELAKSIGKQKIYVTKILSILKLDEEILNDLRINKSTKDIQALYFLQRIGNKEDQVNLYKDFINQVISREDIIEFVKSLNKKEISKEKNTIVFKRNKIEIKSDFSKLSNDIKLKLEDELNKLIQSYTMK